MSSDESSRGMPNYPNRKPGSSNYNGKSHGYNSNSNYSYGNSMYNGNSGSGYNGQQQQHPRRRVDRFKRESISYNERIVKQNDTIIRLLKEIRDRLPAPENTGDDDFQDQTHTDINDATDESSSENEQQDEDSPDDQETESEMVAGDMDETVRSPGNKK